MAWTQQDVHVRMTLRLRDRAAAVARLPRWARGLIGLVAVVLGVLLVTRPLSSLAVLAVYLGLSAIVTGIADITTAPDAATETRGAGLMRALGFGWMLLGLAIIGWLGKSIALLPVVLAVALIVSGIGRWVTATRPATLDERVALVLLGIADVAFGVLALAWPDVTLVVVAVVFGARTLMFGLILLWNAVRSTAGRAPESATATPSLFVRWSRTIGALLMAVIAVAGIALTGHFAAAVPVVDGFYAAPDAVPVEPGELLRSEPFTREIPDGATAWRILYTTTRDEGDPAIASGLVVVPAAPSGVARPVIAWAHGTTGFAQHCAPTLLAEPFTSGGLFVLPEIIDHGWALVATDYPGLGTDGTQPYLIGQGQARSVLDAVRAARQLPAAGLSAETVVWGHSQGGHAALWTGQIQPSYAPDVPLAGVAAMAPAADTIGIARHLPDVLGGTVFASYVISAYAGTYPDVHVDDYVIPEARRLVREMAARCLSEPGVLASVLTALSLARDRQVYRTDPATGPLGARLAENLPVGPFPAPVLLAQGATDPLITPAIQDGYVARLRAAGDDVDYRTYAGLDHLALVGPESPLVGELLAWTGDRFAAAAAAP